MSDSIWSKENHVSLMSLVKEEYDLDPIIEIPQIEKRLLEYTELNARNDLGRLIKFYRHMESQSDFLYNELLETKVSLADSDRAFWILISGIASLILLHLFWIMLRF